MRPNELVVSVDVPKVTPDQARELMFHHLGVACAYFEATPESVEDNLDELHRVFGTDDKDVRHAAVYAFVDSLTRGFDNIRREVQGYEATGYGKPKLPKKPEPRPPHPASMPRPVTPARDLPSPPKPTAGARERPLTDDEKNRLAMKGFDITSVTVGEAGRALGLTVRRQGRGLRVINTISL